MRNKIFKYISVVLLVVILFSVLCTVSHASYEEEMSALITDQDTLWDDNTNTKDKVEKVTGTVIAGARIVGVCIAVVMLLVLAMKYMSAAPSERADIKKSAVVYVVGAVILFGVVGILGIIQDFSTAISVSK